MSIKIIDHKKVDMTNDEWSLYEKICKSYDDVNFKGSDLFSDLFESDNNGIILFLKPPKKRITFEVYFFLMNLMQHQHLRMMHAQVDDVVSQLKNKLKELDAKSKG